MAKITFHLSLHALCTLLFGPWQDAAALKPMAEIAVALLPEVRDSMLLQWDISGYSVPARRLRHQSRRVGNV